MTFEDSRTLAQEQSFRDRVRVAALTAAIGVAAEPTETVNHRNRHNLAIAVLTSPQRWGDTMAEGVAVNSTIAAHAAAGEDISDSEIEFTVNSLWNAYAGQSD